MAGMSSELAAAIIDVAKRNQWDPVDLGTAISYETGGSFDPWKAGPTTQWGQHRGLIQWGQPQAKEYGVTKDMSVTDQMGAVEQYLKDRGMKPGMGMMDLYSTINAGSPGLYNRSDAANGGAPGTVADKVNSQMADHRAKAVGFLQQYDPNMPIAAAAAPSPGAAPLPVQSPVQAPTAAPGAPLSIAPGAAPATAPTNPMAGLSQISQNLLKPAEFDPIQQIQMSRPAGQNGVAQQLAAAIARQYGQG